jgi:hypothetical protein
VRVTAALGVAALIGLGGVGLAYAQTSTTSPPSSSSPNASSGSSPGSSSTTNPSSNPAPHPHERGPKGRLGGFPGLGPAFGFGLGGRGAIHGQVTLPNGNGYETLAAQTGTVSSVSTSSISVKSVDGFEQTYAVTTDTLVNAGRDGIASVKQGDTVNVIATVSGSTSTARQINDVTNIQSSHSKWVPQPPQPSTTTTTG